MQEGSTKDSAKETGGIWEASEQKRGQGKFQLLSVCRAEEVSKMCSGSLWCGCFLSGSTRLGEQYSIHQASSERQLISCRTKGHGPLRFVPASIFSGFKSIDL